MTLAPETGRRLVLEHEAYELLGDRSFVQAAARHVGREAMPWQLSEADARRLVDGLRDEREQQRAALRAPTGTPRQLSLLEEATP